MGKGPGVFAKHANLHGLWKRQLFEQRRGNRNMERLHGRMAHERVERRGCRRDRPWAHGDAIWLSRGVQHRNFGRRRRHGATEWRKRELRRQGLSFRPELRFVRSRRHLHGQRFLPRDGGRRVVSALFSLYFIRWLGTGDSLRNGQSGLRLRCAEQQAIR